MASRKIAKLEYSRNILRWKTDVVSERVLMLVAMAVIACSALAYSARYYFVYSDIKSSILPIGVLLFLPAILRTGLNPLTLFPLVFCGWGAMSGLWAINTFEYARGLAFMAGGTALFYCAAQRDKTRFLRTLSATCGVCLAVVSLYGVLQSLDLDPLKVLFPGVILQSTPNYPASTFGNANFAAHFCVPALLLTMGAGMACWREGRKRIALVSAAVVALGLWFMLAGQSRGGIFALIIGCSVFAAKAVFNTVGNRRLLVVVFVALALALMAGATLTGTLKRMTNFGQTTSYRIAIWKNSTKLITERPLKGVGLWNFDIQIPRVAGTDLTQHQSGIYANERVNRAHNDYLDLAVELGIPAALLFLLFVAAVLKKAAEPAVAGAVAAILAHALVDFPLYNAPSAALFWVLCGIAVAQPANRSFSPGKTILVWSLGAAVCGCAIFVPMRFLQASAYMRDGQSSIESRKTGDALTQYTKAQNVAPGNRNVYPWLTSALRSSGRIDEAHLLVRKWLRLEPYSSQAHNTLGSILAAREQQDEALKAFLQAYRLSDTNYAAAANAATIYYMQSKYGESARLYRKVFAAAPGEFRAMLRNYADSEFEAGNTTEALPILREYLRQNPGDRETQGKYDYAKNALGI